MGKYSPEELNRIAIDVLQARDVGDIRFSLGVSILCDYFNISEEVCINRIEQLAKEGKYQ